MSYEYAAMSFDTKHGAQIMCVSDWATATGSEDMAATLAQYWDASESMVDELYHDHTSGDWPIVYLADDCDRSDVADLLEDWESWARGHAIWEARNELNVNQTEFADMLRFGEGGQSRISEYENRHALPSKQVLMLAWRFVEESVG